VGSPRNGVEGFVNIRRLLYISNVVVSRIFSVILLCFWSTWLWNFAFRTVIPALTPVVQADLSLTGAEVGVVIGVVYAGYSASSILAWKAAEKIGKRKTIIASILVPSITSMPLLLLKDYMPLLAALFVTGLGLGLYLPNALSTLSQIYPEQRRGRVMGIHETAAPLGQGVGPLVAGVLLISRVSWTNILVIWSLVAAPLMMIYVSLRMPENVDQGGEEARVGENPFSYRKTLLIILSATGVGSLQGYVFMMPLYMTSNLKLDAAFAAIVFGAARITGVAGMVGGGWFSDVFGRFRMLLLNTALAIVFALLLLTLKFNMAFVVVLAFFTVFQMAFWPIFFSGISDVTPPRERVKALGLAVASSTAIGAGLFPPVMGLLADMYGMRIALVTPAIFSTCSLVGVSLLSHSRMKTLSDNKEATEN